MESSPNYWMLALRMLGSLALLMYGMKAMMHLTLWTLRRQTMCYILRELPKRYRQLLKASHLLRTSCKTIEKKDNKYYQYKYEQKR